VTLTIDTPLLISEVSAAPARTGREVSRARYPARIPATNWPATNWPATNCDREQVLSRLGAGAFHTPTPNSRARRSTGLAVLLDWLTDAPGTSWQQRWLASGAETDATRWRDLVASWLDAGGQIIPWRLSRASAAFIVAVCADIIRPSLTWLSSGTCHPGTLVRTMATVRDPDGFARLRAACDTRPGVAPGIRGLTLYRAAVILGAKGGLIADITVGDVLEFLDVETATNVQRSPWPGDFYRALHRIGIFPPGTPARLSQVRTIGQRTPAELIDRYHLTCQPVRELLVDYLRERQPALDYTSLRSLAHFLGKMFWADLERHHPGIDSLHLPADVADGWKQRLRTMPKTVTGPDGVKSVIDVERINYRECLTPVRAFYLDLACWAVEDPARWARWVVPCPVGAEEINRRKAKRARKSRIDARTRERLPVLPALVASVAQHHKDAAALLTAARATQPGSRFTAATQTLTRSIAPHASPTITWADDPVTGKRRNLTLEEDHTFWTWAAVEVLRSTGVRIEELLELSHHALIRYRLPGTGEVVPLLQIIPSKTDTERLLVISPDLADVLATILARIRAPGGAVPFVAAYDIHEQAWSTPAPLLFQRHIGTENRAITPDRVRTMLTAAILACGLLDHDGQPLRYTPHDFRRLFITDAILNGLPPHIAQVIAGHHDINVTLGYKAVYPDEAIASHLAFLARRRSLRPSEEYRTPTDAEWQEFLGHFERRKVSTGTCARALGATCIHEHACVRCPMLWPDPSQRPRLIEIRDNLIDRIAEAHREGWHGEAEGLRTSLTGAEDKLAQIDRRPNRDATTG
jgi:hypothetical protein